MCAGGGEAANNSNPQINEQTISTYLGITHGEQEGCQQQENQASEVSSETPLPHYEDDLPSPPPPPLPNNEDNPIASASILASTLFDSDVVEEARRSSVIWNGQQVDEEPKYARVDLSSKRHSRNNESSRNATPNRRRTPPESLPSEDNRIMEVHDEPLLTSSEMQTQLINDESEEHDDNSMALVPISNNSVHAADFSVQRTLSSTGPQRTQAVDVVDISECQAHGSDALQAVVSALYCKILVILGLAFPMAEVISLNVPKGYYQLFYVYLFLGSLLFLLCIYIDLLRTRASWAMANRMCRKSTNPATNEEAQNHESDIVDGGGVGPKIPRPRVHYGSFYLRLGTVLFGIGSMIYSGIEIGMFFELNMDGSSDCKNLFSIIRPILQMSFVFVQMYFIFLNQKMNIYKNKLLSRFGLMHMIATNLCVWLNVLILETSHEIMDAHHTDGSAAVNNHTDIVETGTPIASKTTSSAKGSSPTLNSHVFDISHLVSLCHRKKNIMSQLLADSGPFLFPCTIEYSLICAAVLFVMWKNIAEEHEHYKFQKRRRKISRTMQVLHNVHHSADEDEDEEERPAHHYSVDCSHANTGLFVGIFIMVIVIISLIVFFVLISSKDEQLHSAAITVASMTELALYCLTTLAVLVGMCQVRKLWYDTTRQLELDNLLLIVAQTGVFIYSAFCIIGAFFQLQNHLLAFLASLATLIQTTIQTVFILDASSRYAYTADQVRNKPGREVVTFLLVCNLAMWAINTLETNRADSHPIQVDFYGGDWAWPIITHVSMPLAIFYRFHSTVCLCEIWKKSFKYKANNLSYV